MSKENFWDLIKQAKEVCGQDNDKSYDYIKDRLMQEGPCYAKDFFEILYAYINISYRYSLFSAAIMMGCPLDDNFESFRAWLISQGRDTYLAALKDPDTLADLEPGDWHGCERFMYVGYNAWEETTSEDEYKELDETTYDQLVDDLSEDIEYGEGINYPLERDELTTYLPRLSQKYPDRYPHWDYSDFCIRQAREAGPPPKPEPKDNFEMGGM